MRQMALPKTQLSAATRAAAPARLAAPARRPCVKVMAAAPPMEIPTKYKAMTPVGERILVKCKEAEQATAGGVLLPSSAAEKSTTGQVVGVGGNCEQLKAGDQVCYSKFGLGATSLMFEGTEHLIMKEVDCIGVLPAGGDVSKLQPCADRVLVKPLKAGDASSGGVLLPESAKDKPMSGEVIAVGPGTKENKVTVKAGEKVVYFKYAGDKMKGGDGQLYVVLRQNDIFGKTA